MWYSTQQLKLIGWAITTVTKRIVNGNKDTQYALDNDNAACANLQYQNTPIQDIGLSLAQLLHHQQLFDSVSSKPILYKPHPEWIVAAQCCKESFTTTIPKW